MILIVTSQMMELVLKHLNLDAKVIHIFLKTVMLLMIMVLLFMIIEMTDHQVLSLLMNMELMSHIETLLGRKHSKKE